MTDRHEKKFHVDGNGKVRKLGALRPHMPVYQPDDPRIQQDLRRGAGVGVDLSSLSPEQATKWWEDRQAELYAGGIRRKATDVIMDANELMRQPLHRFPCEEDDESSE